MNKIYDIAKKNITDIINSNCSPVYSCTAYISHKGIQDLSYMLKIPTSKIEEIIYPMMREGASGGGNMIEPSKVAEAILKLESMLSETP